MRKLGNLAVITLLASAFAAPSFTANAQHHSGGVHGQAGGFHGHDIHHFGGHDLGVWRSGHWARGWHGERFGWWWTFGAPWWYAYPAPIYPYPDPYIPSTVIVEQAPALTGPPPIQYWYYCDSPKGYYPYVSACPSSWRLVLPAPSNQR